MEAVDVDRNICTWCGGDEWVEVRAWAETLGTQMCVGCGRWVTPTASTPWRGDPVHMVDPRWDRRNAVAIRDGDAPVAILISGQVPTVTVWCGPAADRPLPPSPEDILWACGVDPGGVFV
jgi:hypothetical protein